MATTKTTTSRNDFDFDAYNAVMSKANAGLKLFLTTQLLGDVVTSAVRYRNPMAGELVKALESVEDLRTEWKLQANKQAKETTARLADRNKPVADANEHEAVVY
jgi:hypothetical protein